MTLEQSVDNWLLSSYSKIGMEKPNNHSEIKKFVIDFARNSKANIPIHIDAQDYAKGLKKYIESNWANFSY